MGDTADLELTREQLVVELKRLRRFQEIVQATSDFVGFLDAKTSQILWINDAGRSMCGIHVDEDVTQLQLTTFHPEWALRKLAGEIMPTAAKSGVWRGDCAFRNRAGREIPVSMVLSAHRDPGGEVAMFSTISRDITEKMAVMERLARHRDEQAVIAEERDQSLLLLQEQARLAEEQTRLIVDLQRKSILELSTPVIQVWDEILVLPLIGAIDTARARQVMESLLDAVVRTRAAVVIMDVTGVPVVDTKVADHLIKTVQATRLLGAEAILTGISPSNAQTLVRLGVDLAAITTQSSLQAGLGLAFARTRKRVTRE